MKAELASEYESSEQDSMDYEELGIDKEEYEMMKNDYAGKKDEEDD